jgi:hypothetical protein
MCNLALLAKLMIRKLNQLDQTCGCFSLRTWYVAVPCGSSSSAHTPCPTVATEDDMAFLSGF